MFFFVKILSDTSCIDTACVFEHIHLKRVIRFHFPCLHECKAKLKWKSDGVSPHVNWLLIMYVGMGLVTFVNVSTCSRGSLLTCLVWFGMMGSNQSNWATGKLFLTVLHCLYKHPSKHTTLIRHDYNFILLLAIPGGGEDRAYWSQISRVLVCISKFLVPVQGMF